MFGYSRQIGIALGGVVLLSSLVRAMEPTNNAALVHWQAFAQLPAGDDQSSELLVGAATVALDERTAKLVSDSTAALTAMRRAATKPTCDWGLDFDAGPHMVMPHLAKTRQMARYACLHARHQVANGQTDAALDTIRDTFVLARHAGADDVIISVLVQNAIERLVIETVCHELPSFDREQLDELAAAVDSLPRGSSLTAALKTEADVFLGWARRVVNASKTDEEAVQQLRSIVLPADDRIPATVQRELIKKWLEGTAKDYVELREIFELPGTEFQPRWDALIKRVREENPYSSMVLPGMDGIRASRDRDTVTWALFRAAIAVQRDGPATLASIKDPFNNGPFTYEKLPNGFRISSKLQFRDSPMQLTVGH